jgi:hypothetical protein
MAKGYTSAGQVALMSGQTLTADQSTMLDFILEQVEAFIDAETGSAWLTGGVTNERHPGPLDGPRVKLRQAPVTAVSSVVGHTGWQAADVETLVAETGYGVDSYQGGTLFLPDYGRFRRHGLTVSYIPAVDLPWQVNRAAAVLAAAMLPSAGGGDVDPTIVKSYQVGGDLTVVFRDAIASAGGSPEIRRLLGSVRRWQVA